MKDFLLSLFISHLVVVPSTKGFILLFGFILLVVFLAIKFFSYLCKQAELFERKQQNARRQQLDDTESFYHQEIKRLVK